MIQADFNAYTDNTIGNCEMSIGGNHRIFLGGKRSKFIKKSLILKF